MSERTEPLIIKGDEQSKIDPNLPDAGLPPAVGRGNVRKR